ncbi:TVP38/TMEM64 family protein [Anaerocolumna sp.]|uniref:TVP38/TMEM64 family protein n=1 Tax=Anaerocolumna sp. TaxID=2041569 RepID=UPI0028AE44A5|nr:TVP38/TMEM64 family protein [Anaerocolumna sp.]
MQRKKLVNILLKFSTWIGLAVFCLFILYGYKTGLFSSAESFREFILRFGMWSGLIFVLIQIAQVIVPIIPGAVSCVAGIVIFGPWVGFLYNYIGICIGSILVFLLSKKYGKDFVKGIIGEKSYNKYIGWIDRGRKFDTMFALAIFFPVAPDDLLCYIAGLTKMKLEKFVAIILLGKPMSIALYSLGLTSVGQYLLSFIK